jgi:hypothetical protein
VVKNSTSTIVVFCQAFIEFVTAILSWFTHLEQSMLLQVVLAIKITTLSGVQELHPNPPLEG